MPRLSKIGAAALAAFGWTSGVSAVTATYLVVAGGGGGGADEGGGGGGGGYQTSTLSLNPTLSYTVTVGAGGAGGVSGVSRGTSGSDSVFSSVTSTGGGGGGSNSDTINNGLNGGSGGGASTTTSASGVSGTGGTGTVGQGSNGGTGYRTAGVSVAGGGGGGASAAGANASSGVGGNGGAGSTSSISGTSTGYAGGGGGGCRSTAGTATQGGGAGSTSGNASNGTSNLGGGGGGGRVNGGQGGSGIVIISYPGSQQFSGGVVTSSGGNTIHTFTTSGTLGPITTLNASYLIVAGGASGGNGNANIRVYGGGGAGGMLTGSGLTIDPNSTYIVTVGAGGASQTVANTAGYNGSNSSFSAVATTAVGGGNAGSFQSGNGGSGGGGGYDGSLYSPGSGTAGQGNNGGTGTTTGGGGGGGAGAVGGNASGGTGGVGGAGSASSISGTSTYYAGGGGGGGASSNGAGGVGGGGSGSTAGTANTGGGGGGTATNITSGAGGSGIVIISYPGSTQQMAGGTVTITGGNVIHTFTSTGYLAPLKYVGNSLRFRASASAYLSRTPTTASNRQTWTWSAWVKLGTNTADAFLFAAGTDANNTTSFKLSNGNQPQVSDFTGGGTNALLVTSQVLRDPAAWYHIIVVYDTTNATSSSRIRIFINGLQVTSFSSATYPSQNYSGYVNSTNAFNMGRSSASTAYFDGYMTEINFVDGQALTPSSFGTFNSYGVWQPITYGGSYGTNGFYLPFPNSATGSTLTANFLVVAGGGAGGSNAANGAGTGGGGAGGFRTSAGTSGGGASAESALTLYAAQSYVVTVGAGGAANSGGNLGSNGSNSTFSTITATGGGGGSYANATSGSSGGSGGGSGRNISGQVGGAGTANQGYAGGNGYNGTPYRGGGGGGAGAVGVDGVTSGNGGAGVSSSITGSAVTYAGGGGGGLFQSGAGGTAGSGGSGGGGAGGNAGSNGTAGTANLGGGGGGGGSTSSTGYNAGAGGSGVVVISYAGPQRYTGGTVTTSGGNTIHTFTSSGVLTSIFNDFSPNGNNWTGNNFDVTNTTATTYDSMTDVPTLTSATAANYCVINPLDVSGSVSASEISNANLTFSCGSTLHAAGGTFAMTSGKWYWENTVTTLGTAHTIGIALVGQLTSKYYAYVYDGTKYIDNVSQGSYGASYTSGDVIGIAFDADAGTLTFYKNGTSQGTAFTGIASNTWCPFLYVRSSVDNLNYGQRPFTYTPPTGFVALNTFNL